MKIYNTHRTCEIYKAYYEKYWQGTLDKKNTLYADPPNWPKKETNRILKAMGGQISGKVLDIGCGNGTLTRKLDSYLQLTGMDISEAAIRQAKNNRFDYLKYSVGDAIFLPYKSNSFDCVILIEVLEHIFDTIAVLSEINRILKTNGKLFITTTDFNFLKKLIISLFLFDRYFYPTNPHIRIFTKKTLKSLLCKTGFRVIHYQWNGSYWGIMPMGQIVICEKMGIN